MVKIQNPNFSSWAWGTPWGHVLSLKCFCWNPVLSGAIRYSVFQPVKFATSLSLSGRFSEMNRSLFWIFFTFYIFYIFRNVITNQKNWKHFFLKKLKIMTCLFHGNGLKLLLIFTTSVQACLYEKWPLKSKSMSPTLTPTEFSTLTYYHQFAHRLEIHLYSDKTVDTWDSNRHEFAKTWHFKHTDPEKILYRMFHIGKNIHCFILMGWFLVWRCTQSKQL